MENNSYLCSRFLHLPFLNRKVSVWDDDRWAWCRKGIPREKGNTGGIAQDFASAGRPMGER